MNPEHLKHRACFQDKSRGTLYFLLKIDHPVMESWILVSEFNHHWISPQSTPIDAFGGVGWYDTFEFVKICE